MNLLASPLFVNSCCCYATAWILLAVVLAITFSTIYRSSPKRWLDERVCGVWCLAHLVVSVQCLTYLGSSTDLIRVCHASRLADLNTVSIWSLRTLISLWRGPPVRRSPCRVYIFPIIYYNAWSMVSQSCETGWDAECSNVPIHTLLRCVEGIA